MTYATSNSPYLITQGIGGVRKMWAYSSSDPTATVRAAGYFTNGYDLGMRANDIVILHDTTTQIVSSHTILTATAGTTTVDLGDGTTIGATANS